jgi:VanZ family protein
MDNTKYVRWLTAAFSLFLGLVILLADLDRLPGVISYLITFRNSDVAGHFILFGILACLLTLSFPGKSEPLSGIHLPVAIGLLAVFIVLEEISQLFIRSRTFSFIDLTASLAGWGLGFTVAIWLLRRKAVFLR